MTLPLIPIENVYYLFCYAWNRFDEAQTISVGGDASPDLPNLLAKVLISGTRSMLRRGLDRGYLPLEEELSTISGHIELGPTLRLQARNVRRVQCTYDELSRDLLHNQLLKASLTFLSKAQTLEPSLSRELRSLAARMADVSDMCLNGGAFARVQLHRNNARYDLLLQICRLAFESLIPTESGTGYAFHDVLRDERKMSQVFEDFVRNFYRARQRRFAVKPLQLEWRATPLVATEGVRLPTMRTDIYLESSDRRIIIDTKYYAEALQERYGATSFRSDNLYQLFAYLRNDALASPTRPLSEGLLLYPEVRHTLSSAYEVHGHRLSLATIDLTRSWSEIEQRLLELIA